MLKKVLWIAFDHQPEELIRVAKYITASGVAIRTSDHFEPGEIPTYQQAGLRVYGWLFPAVIPGHRHYALDEAKRVAKDLIPAGLDGYFADPEGDERGSPRN